MAGRDDRQVEPPRARKSVGAEVNWGVRFQTTKEAEDFLEVSPRAPLPPPFPPPPPTPRFRLLYAWYFLGLA